MRFVLISILFFLGVLQLSAQQPSDTIDTVTYIQPDKIVLNTTDESLINISLNTIGNEQYLAPFFAQLSSLEKKKQTTVSAAHIGDSHIQADMLTEVVRTGLQQTFGNAGRGLVFPYKAAHTNEPDNYKSSTNVKWEVHKIVNKQAFNNGISGICMRTIDSAASIVFSIANRPGLDYSFKKVTLFMNKNVNSFDVSITNVRDSVLKTISSQDTNKSAFLVSTKLDSFYNSIKIKPLISNVCQHSALYYGFRFERDCPGLFYDAIGINGATFGNYLYDSFFTQLASTNPQLIIVSLGTNDVYTAAFNETAFENNFCNFISMLKRYMPNASVIITTPPDCYRNRKYRLKSLQTVRDIIIRECNMNHFAYWDFYSIMGGYGSMQKWFLKGYSAKDKIHFSAKGYRLQGYLLLKALLNSYKNYGK